MHHCVSQKANKTLEVQSRSKKENLQRSIRIAASVQPEGKCQILMSFSLTALRATWGSRWVVTQSLCQKQIKIQSESTELRIRHQNDPTDRVARSMNSDKKCQTHKKTKNPESPRAEIANSSIRPVRNSGAKAQWKQQRISKLSTLRESGVLRSLTAKSLIKPQKWKINKIKICGMIERYPTCFKPDEIACGEAIFSPRNIGKAE